MSAYLRLDGLGVRFSPAVTIGPVSLELTQGEILALLGPSGSGKTTLLRLLAGFEHPDFGRVAIEDEDVTRIPPARRRVGMVFQHYALFPHLDVGANVAFGLSPETRRGATRDAQVSEALGLVDLAGFERRRIQELSGGQQQRVALARALAPAPRVLLLDEPLSNLDPSLRERTRRELRQVIKRVGITAVFVTHEQEEAFDLGDRIAVLNGGQLQQVGTAEDLYERPTSLFVGTFVGRANVLRGASAAALGAEPGRAVLVRPEHLRIEPNAGTGGSGGGGPAKGRLGGVVTERRYTGAAAFLQVTTTEGVRVEVLADPHAARVGDTVTLVAARHLAFPEEPLARTPDGQEARA